MGMQVGGYFRALLHRPHINHELYPRLGLLVSVRYNLHEDRPKRTLFFWIWKMWINVCATVRNRNKHANTEENCVLGHDVVQWQIRTDVSEDSSSVFFYLKESNKDDV
jgi:hypothetical protein